MRKLEKMWVELSDAFRDKLSDAIRAEYGIETEHAYVGLLSPDGGRLVTVRTDGEDFTSEQRAYIAAFSDGYVAAMRMVEMAS